MNQKKKITTRDIERYRIAYSVAEESPCRFQMGASIYLGARFITCAHNVVRTHPIQIKEYGKHVISIHAEFAALIKSRTNISGATMYIARASAHKNTSKPCHVCEELMRLAGVKYIVYTIKGELVKELL